MLDTVGLVTYSPLKGTQTEWAEKTIKELEQRVRDIQKQLLQKINIDGKRGIIENETATLTAILEFKNYLNDENKFVSEKERLAIKKNCDEKITKLEIALHEEIPLDEVGAAIKRGGQSVSSQ